MANKGAFNLPSRSQTFIPHKAALTQVHTVEPKLCSTTGPPRLFKRSLNFEECLNPLQLPKPESRKVLLQLVESVRQEAFVILLPMTNWNEQVSGSPSLSSLTCILLLIPLMATAVLGLPSSRGFLPNYFGSDSKLLA